MANNIKPSVGLIFKVNSTVYKIVSIHDLNIRAVRLKDNGEESIKHKNWTISEWENLDIEIPSADNNTAPTSESMNSGSANGQNQTKNGKYHFIFDTEKNVLRIEDSAGTVITTIDAITGPEGISFFKQWAINHGLNPNDQATWVKAEEFFKGKDAKGVNGLSAYELWKAKQPAGVDTSEDAFWNSLKGEDGSNGKDGKSAYEVWKSIRPSGADTSLDAFWASLKGKDGNNGHEGKDGENGQTWMPYLKDGKLYFENTTTHERTEVFDLTGPQGPDGFNGKDGDEWEPYLTNDSHQLYFKNQHGVVRGPFNVVGATGKEGKPGSKGESAYDIWINEGHRGDYHDFLLWIAKQAGKGDNGEDGDTYVPHLDNGCLSFISQKTGKQIKFGSIIGPEGPKGDTGLNGHNVTHKYGYKEIKDWTCPVQEINPLLIASSDDLVSGSSAEAHMRETLNRINNIRKEGSKKEYRGNWVQEWFWWCSGADKNLLRMCPAEHSKYFGIGTVIFFTALMAFFSSYVAISYVFGGVNSQTGNLKFTGLALGFALFWSAMIFCLDRFITNTMYSDGKVTISWLELRSALPRILISIFLGIVISAPLELIIFRHEVDEYLCSQSISKDLQINTKEQQLDSLRLNLEKSVLDFSNSIKPDRNNYTKKESLDKSKAGNTGTRLIGDGQNTERVAITGKINVSNDTILLDPIAFDKAIRQWNQDVKQYRRDLEDQIESLSKSIENLKKQKRYSYKADNYGLYDRLVALHEIAFKEGQEDGYIPWVTDIFTQDEVSYDNEAENLSRPTNLIVQNDSLDINEDLDVSAVVKDDSSHSFNNDETKADAKYSFNLSIGNPLFWFFGIFVLLIIVSWPFTANVTKDSDSDDNAQSKPSGKELKQREKELVRRGRMVLWPWFAVAAFICAICCNALFNALPYYIFSAVGMIMMLFILIDVSPVFYKMMLADGQYEQYLHKEKSITQDLIRLNFAKSIAKVNESEIGRLAPLIFSKPFDKIKKVLKRSVKTQKEELGWVETDNEGNEIGTAREEINSSNRDLFMTVLGMKNAIIRASYQAWYRDMRDAVIGMHKPDHATGTPANPNTNDDANDNNPSDNLTSPSSLAERETGHHSADDAPFDRNNKYGARSGTSPDYETSSDDSYSGTPEDILREQDRNSGLYGGKNDSSTYENSADDNPGNPSSANNDDTTDTSSEAEDNVVIPDNTSSSSHLDSDVESEISGSDDEDDDEVDTINPK